MKRERSVVYSTEPRGVRGGRASRIPSDERPLLVKPSSHPRTITSSEIATALRKSASKDPDSPGYFDWFFRLMRKLLG